MRPSSAPGNARPPHLHCSPLETPIGDLWICVTDRGLYEISRHAPAESGGVPDARTVARVADQLLDYFTGTSDAFDVELDLSGVGPFDLTVWQAARAIPYGETVSYGELALMAGYPRAARAAGGSMARCRLFPIVPCHRVVHADGSIGGWGGEEWVKRWLIELERGHRQGSVRRGWA
jgi:methylated-DNA-[protein]-cysteine S-methyltransferase